MQACQWARKMVIRGENALIGDKESWAVTPASVDVLCGKELSAQRQEACRNKEGQDRKKLAAVATDHHGYFYFLFSVRMCVLERGVCGRRFGNNSPDSLNLRNMEAQSLDRLFGGGVGGLCRPSLL